MKNCHLTIERCDPEPKENRDEERRAFRFSSATRKTTSHHALFQRICFSNVIINSVKRSCITADPKNGSWNLLFSQLFVAFKRVRKNAFVIRQIGIHFHRVLE